MVAFIMSIAYMGCDYLTHIQPLADHPHDTS